MLLYLVLILIILLAIINIYLLIKLNSRLKNNKTPVNNKGPGYSKILASVSFIFAKAFEMAVLYLCYLCIKSNYTGSLPALSALAGLEEASITIILAFYFNKSKAENTSGGIVHDLAIANTQVDTDDISV